MNGVGWIIALILFAAGLTIGLVMKFHLAKRQIDQEFYDKRAKIERDIIEKTNEVRVLSLQTAQLQDKLSYQQRQLNIDLKDRQEQLTERMQVEEELKKEQIAKILNDFSSTYSEKVNNQVREKDEEFALISANFSEKTKELLTDLEELQAKRRAALEVAKHEEEIRLQADFYKLQIPEDMIEDIVELKKLEKRFNYPEVLNKMIYKYYVEKAYTDLVGRVIGLDKKTGIYKITNIKDGRIYIGQAVDLAARWKQHIKRALGAEPMTQNKLYPAMAEQGVWNFTFEVVEICKKDQLNEREQYYQDFFNAKEFGYSIK